MIELAPYVPIFIQLVILAGTIYVARSARPKLVAETKQGEAEGAHPPVNGVSSLGGRAGKNERSAQWEAYLLTIFQRVGGKIVKASPTFKPQTLNSLQRLKDRLKTPWHAGRVRHRSGYIVEVGEARAMFFSAEPRASTVGATAERNIARA